MIADPDVNLLVMGAHPDPKQKRDVFHWFEMRDAVQLSHSIDGVAVSNFVLPLYSREATRPGGRNDFLAVAKGRRWLRSFGVNPGAAYIGFYDPVLGEHKTYELDGDATPRAGVRSSWR